VAAKRRRTTRAGNKLLAGPPTDYPDVDPTFDRIAPGSVIYRLYSPEPYKTRPATFRRYGPIARFDHHRAGAGGARRRDRNRGIVYASRHFVCSMGEKFGDPGEVKLAGNRVARLAVDEELCLVDLCETAATGVGTTQAIGADGRRKVTQAWGRWLYDHPQLADADGLRYTSFHTGLPAIALWERARGKVRCPRGNSWDLASSVLRTDVQVAAFELHLPIAP
jgi:RES domain